MDITGVTIESGYKFLKFHEAFNRTVKTMTAGLTSLRHVVGPDRTSSDVLALFIGISGEPWGRQCRWPNPVFEIDQAGQFFAEMAIARVCSAFEDFLTGVEADFHRLEREARPREKDSDETLLISQRVCRHFGLSEANHTKWLPCINFFFQFRHRIVHADGRIGDKLRDLVESPSLITSWNDGPRRASKTVPPIPVCKEDRIEVKASHAIYFSSVCLAVVNDINAEFFKQVSWKEYLKLTAHHSTHFGDSLRIRGDAIVRSAEALLVRYIVERRIKARPSRETVINELKRQGIWKTYLNEFRPIRPTPKAKSAKPAAVENIANADSHGSGDLTSRSCIKAR